MNIHDLKPVAPPKTVAKPSTEELRHKKIQGQESAKIDSVGPNSSEPIPNDMVEISEEAQQLNKSQDELGVYKELLAKLPSTRAHVIYEALAKIRSGLYSKDEIVEEAAKKLLDSPELNDLIQS
jgi:hypothetical protein